MVKLSLLAALFALSLAAQADGNRPASPEDLVQIEQLQRRVDKLAFGPFGPNGYTLSKARAWLDMALVEYYQQERTGIVQDAIAQATALLDALSDNPMFIGHDTAQPEASEKVRPDLWEKADALKKRGNLTCGGRKIAELEVQLVWTGHYKWESGWSHAEPSARIAENLAYEAQFEFDPSPCTAFAKIPAPAIAKLPTPALASLPATAVAELPAPKAVKPATSIERRTLPTDLMFAYARSSLSDEYMKYRGNEYLNKIVAELQSWKTLKKIQIIGHTDRLGKEANITRIALERAEQIKSYFVSQGIPAGLIEAKGVGATQPKVSCPEQRDTRAMIKCLQPNRRIEMIIEGVRK